MQHECCAQDQCTLNDSLASNAVHAPMMRPEQVVSSVQSSGIGVQKFTCPIGHDRQHCPNGTKRKGCRNSCALGAMVDRREAEKTQACFVGLNGDQSAIASDHL